MDHTIESFAEQAGQATLLLKAMANQNRLMVLCQLGNGELSAGDLQRRLPLSQSALSQHLAKLRAENLVSTRRQGVFIYYSIQSPAALMVIDRLQEIFCPEIKNGT